MVQVLFLFAFNETSRLSNGRGSMREKIHEPSKLAFSSKWHCPCAVWSGKPTAVCACLFVLLATSLCASKQQFTTVWCWLETFISVCESTWKSKSLASFSFSFTFPQIWCSFWHFPKEQESQEKEQEKRNSQNIGFSSSFWTPEGKEHQKGKCNQGSNCRERWKRCVGTCVHLASTVD